MPIEEVVDGVIDVIKKNIIAQANVTSNITTGDTVINVDNAFQMKAGQEIVIMDFGFNQPGHIHENVLEYAKIKQVNNTRSVTLNDEVVSNWTVTDRAFIQKTIGHSPLHPDLVLYGDREVIPSQEMAITVEPVTLSNEWIYIQGGLSEEFRIRIMIYGKSVSTEEGRRILDRYSDAVYQLLNDRVHLDVGAHNTPLMEDVANGAMSFRVQDTLANRNFFVPSSSLPNLRSYFLQDNRRRSRVLGVASVTIEGGGTLKIDTIEAIDGNYLKSEFGVAFRVGTYIYDSRVDGITYGQVSKGSALLRASELNWFGKRVNEHLFPQQSKAVNSFEEIP